MSHVKSPRGSPAFRCGGWLPLHPREAASAPLRGMAIEVRLSDPPLALAASPVVGRSSCTSQRPTMVLDGQRALDRLEGHILCRVRGAWSVGRARARCISRRLNGGTWDRWRPDHPVDLRKQSRGRINAYQGR